MSRFFQECNAALAGSGRTVPLLELALAVGTSSQEPAVRVSSPMTPRICGEMNGGN
jgi:hypothetical protein